MTYTARPVGHALRIGVPSVILSAAKKLAARVAASNNHGEIFVAAVNRGSSE